MIYLEKLCTRLLYRADNHCLPSYGWNIVATFLHEIDPWETTNRNAQSTRQSDIMSTEMKLVYCLTRKTLKYNILFQNICIFLQKETSYCKSSFVLCPQWPKHCIFGDHMYLKTAEGSDSMYSFFFMLENMWYHYFNWSGLNSQDIADFVPIVSPQEPKLNW